MLSNSNELQSIAAEYASHGLAVIPALPRSKKPAVPWRVFEWEPPTHAERDEMFSRGGGLNVGVICGAASQNLAVLDAETETAFADVVSRYESLGLGDTWIVKTKRGGHLYLSLPVAVRPVKGRDLELRAQGQYVLAPPSLHPDGPRYEFLQRPSSIVRVPSLSAIDWLKLEAAPRNHFRHLPRKAKRLLQGQQTDHYLSRSEAEQAIVTVLVNARFAFDEVLVVFRRYPAAGKFNELYRQDQTCAVKWLKHCFEQARAWCLQESPSRKLAREILARAQTMRWTGRTGSSDRAVLLAHATLAHRAGSPTYHASSRDLAELAGCERKTASRASQRLIRNGVVELIKPSTHLLANRYQLTKVNLEVSELTPLTTTTCEGVGQTSSYELPDAFRQSGLGRAAFEVLNALQGNPLPAKDVARKTGRHVQTVRRALAQMKNLGLVEKLSRTWRGAAISEIDLEALATTLGTNGARKCQREKHQAERVRHRISSAILLHSTCPANYTKGL